MYCIFPVEVHSNKKQRRLSCHNLENFGGVLIEARGLGGSFSWSKACLAYGGPWFDSQHCLKQAWVVDACRLSPQKVETVKPVSQS